MASNPASELASAIQSVSLNRAPSPSHDINPSTAASIKIPADLISPTHSRSSSLSSISSEVLIAPRPRRKSFPPIPDFRFEQSYLASIQHADSNWRVAYITARDQVVMPLAQGILWNLVVVGWKFWNNSTRLKGTGLGARFRRWWWEVNNWKVPEAKKEKISKDYVGGAREFFVEKFGSSTGD